MVLIAEDAVIHTPRRLILPRSLADIDYTISGSYSTETRITIDTRNSYFRGEWVGSMRPELRRKIENLFIISYPKEKIRIRFI